MNDREPSGASRCSRRLILVTGAGRSGTSTVAGTLHYLGLHVPLPVLQPNKSNPRGFFESTWPLWFHRRIMDRADIEQVDGRPDALHLMHDAVTEETRHELLQWLSDVVAEAPQVVVKDPRSSWVPQLWIDAAGQLDMQIGFVTMLRHPAEVLGSRSTYYGTRHDDTRAWDYAVMNLAGWVNQTLNAERQTRGQVRVHIQYHDLLEDWRREMARVRDANELRFNHGLGEETHKVDDFIDPGLRRHELRFEDMDLPHELTSIAESVWGAMCRLAESNGSDRRAETDLDDAAAAYRELYRSAAAIARDHTQAVVRATRASVEEECRNRMRRRVRKVRAKAREEAVAELRARAPGRRAYRAVRGVVRRRSSS